MLQKRLLPALMVTCITSAMLFCTACSTQNSSTTKRISNLTSNTVNTSLSYEKATATQEESEFASFETFAGYGRILCSCPALIVDSGLHDTLYHDTIVEIVGKDTSRFLIKWPGGKQAIINKSLVSVLSRDPSQLDFTSYTWLIPRDDQNSAQMEELQESQE